MAVPAWVYNLVSLFIEAMLGGKLVNCYININ